MNDDIPPLTRQQGRELKKKLSELLENQPFILLLRLGDNRLNILTNEKPETALFVIKTLAQDLGPLENL